jgi:hypothetical protein
MKTKFLVLAGVAALGLAAPAHAGVIINVNGKTNAGQLPAGNPLATPVTVFLNQGRYLLTFVAPPTPGANWTAANVWTRGGQPGVTGCNSGGSNCAEGWFNRIEYYLGGNAGSALTLGSSSVPNRYNTAALSFANSGGYFAEIIPARYADHRQPWRHQPVARRCSRTRNLGDDDHGLWPDRRRVSHSPHPG